AGDTGATWSPRLFPSQMAAAIVAIAAGIILLATVPQSARAGMVLGIGALLALIAAGVQGAMVAAPARRLAAAASASGGAGAAAAAPQRQRILAGNRLAAALLAVTVACMAAAMHL